MTRGSAGGRNRETHGSINVEMVMPSVEASMQAKQEKKNDELALNFHAQPWIENISAQIPCPMSIRYVVVRWHPIGSGNQI